MAPDPSGAGGTQAQFILFADIIWPPGDDATSFPTGFQFADPAWLMPLPDFSAAAPHAAETATRDPAGAAPDSSMASALAEQDTEPFGVSAAPAPRGLLWTKWRKVQRDIEATAPVLTRCRAAVSGCSPAAARFAAIIEDAAKHYGRARLELVNARVNAAIRYVSDWKQWRSADRWSAPLERRHTGSFETGIGDCEDYAIAKYVALREAGTAARDLRLLMVHDQPADIDHAVLAVREHGQWLILDNRWRRLIEDRDAQFFTPLFALDGEGVQRFAVAGHPGVHAKGRGKARARIVAAGPARVSPSYD